MAKFNLLDYLLDYSKKTPQERIADQFGVKPEQINPAVNNGVCKPTQPTTKYSGGGGSSSGSSGGGGSAPRVRLTVDTGASVRDVVGVGNKIATITQTLREDGKFSEESLAKRVGVEDPVNALLRGKRYQELNKLKNEADSLQQQADVLEKRYSDFNSRYGGKELSKQDYDKAMREQEALQYASMELNRKIREYEDNVKADEQSKSISKSSLAQTMILDPRQAPKTILPGQKGYGELGIPSTKKREPSGVIAPVLSANPPDQRFKVELVDDIRDTFALDIFKRGKQEVITDTTTGKQLIKVTDTNNVYYPKEQINLFGAKDYYTIKGKDVVLVGEKEKKELLKLEKEQFSQSGISLATGTLLPSPTALGINTAKSALTSIGKTTFTSKPVTVATVRGDKVYTTTTFKVRVGKIFPKDYEIVSKAVLTKTELEKELIKKASLKITETKSSGLLVSDVTKKGVFNINISPTLKEGAGKQITDVLYKTGAIQKFVNGAKGSSGFSNIKGLNKALGEIVFSRTEGVTYVRQIGLIEKLKTGIIPQAKLTIKKTVSSAEKRVLSSNKTVSSLLDVDTISQVSPRRLNLLKSPISKAYTPTTGKNLYNVGITGTKIKAPLSKSTSLTELGKGKLDDFINFSKSRLSKVRQDLQYSLTGTKGKTVSKQFFPDKSSLTSPTQKFKTLDLSIKTKEGNIVISRIKTGKYPEQLVYTQEAKSLVPKGFGDGFRNPITKRLSEGKELFLGEAKKSLPGGQKLLTGKTSQTQLTQIAPDDKVLDNIFRRLNIGVKNVGSLTKDLPKVSLESAKGGISVIQQQQLVQTAQRASGGTLILLKEKLKQDTGLISGTKTVGLVKPKVEVKVGVDYKSSGQFRESLRNETYSRTPTRQQNSFPKRYSPESLILPKQVVVPLINQKTNVTSGSGSKTISGVDSKSLIGQSVGQPQVVAFAQPSVQKVNLLVGQKQNIAQRVGLKQPQINLTKTFTITRPVVRFPTTVRPPFVPVIPLPSFKFGKVGFGPGSANVKKGFSVFSRVGGKEKVLAVNVPKGVALSIGKSFTGRTTARSFKIKEAGFTRQKDVALPGLFQYRSPKLGGRVSKEGFTFVEKSKYAIDTLSEASELKSARRAKKKKRK